MKVRIKKLEELKNALHPNNIEVGYERIIDVHPDYFEEPKLDRRFNIGSFSTSGVQEIIDEKTFRTYSSVYEWEVLK